MLLNRDDGAVVSDVRIGLGYTAVALDDGRGGVAFTFREHAKGGCSVFRKLRPLTGRHPSELVALLPSDDPIEAAVGLACANALINVESPGLQEGDVLRRLDLRPDDHVGMVGHFGPLVEILDRTAHRLTVFERAPRASRGSRPAEEAEDILPTCQVAFITATSIINHTMDQLLEAASNCREVVILGASTPLLPEVFFSRNVTLLSGVIVLKPRGVLQIVSEGGGMQQFGSNIRKVCVREKKT
ncbi:MAG: DUF364 domain-containing protein [Gemmatimonadota bacterium]